MRERDIRNSIALLLESTNAFSSVWITGLPEQFGQGADDLTAAAIEPVGGNLKTGWDAQLSGSLDFAGSCTVTLLARNSDAQLRDEQAEQLLDFLNNAVNGQSLAGFTLPAKTLVTGWRWQAPTPPERRISATVSYEYIVTWNSFDTSN